MNKLTRSLLTLLFLMPMLMNASSVYFTDYLIKKKGCWITISDAINEQHERIKILERRAGGEQHKNAEDLKQDVDNQVLVEQSKVKAANNFINANNRIKEIKQIAIYMLSGNAKINSVAATVCEGYVSQDNRALILSSIMVNSFLHLCNGIQSRKDKPHKFGIAKRIMYATIEDCVKTHVANNVQRGTAYVVRQCGFDACRDIEDKTGQLGKIFVFMISRNIADVFIDNVCN